MNQDEQIFELEKQLHEGYVVNNNAKAGFLASLIAAIVGAIGVYGYVFAHTAPRFVSLGEPYYIKEHLFSIDVLVMAMIACQFVLVFLYCISCSLGVSQRLEQFITFAIRCKAYAKNPEEYKKVFPKKYCPFGKEGKDIIIGVFGKICCVLQVIFIIITLTTIIRLFLCCWCTLTACRSILWIIAGVLSSITLPCVFCCIFKYNAKKYKERINEYYGKNIECPYTSKIISQNNCDPDKCSENKEEDTIETGLKIKCSLIITCMKKLFLSLVWAVMCLSTIAQPVTLTFTGRDAKNQHVQLNRVVITNLTQNWQETIYYPDTILMMGSTSINEVDNADGFKLSQNVPNPFDGTTDFALQLPEAGKVSLTVYDLIGKKITAYQGKLASGVHTFRVLLNTTQSYLLTARCGNETATIKMINNGNAGENAIRHLGDGNLNMLLKNGTKGTTNKPFAFGDNMIYMGYATIN